jgi:CTD small phosphatase-like protein 2
MLPPLTLEQTCRPNLLPQKTRSSPPITLVLDLDETLVSLNIIKVHCSTSPLDPCDVKFPVFLNGINYSVCGRFRPNYEKFLLAVSQKFEVVIFTASQKVYADELINFLDPNKTLIKYRLFRDSCLFVSGSYLKDLGVLGRDLSKIGLYFVNLVIVDNSPQAFGYQLNNGVPIISWYNNAADVDLLRVLAFLEKLENVNDVR